MPSKPRTRRPHPLVAASLTLAVLAGCMGPTAPTGPRKGSGAGGGAPAAGPAGASGPATGSTATGGTQILTNGLGTGAAPKAPGDPGAAAAAAGIDTQKYLIGRVFVPLGIVSNNGGSVIGQNGAGVIGQNGAGVIGQNGAGVIGQNGAGVIGQNGAGVIGQNGAGVIGQNGAGVIGQNGAGVIGQNGAGVIGQNGAGVIGQNGAGVIGQNGAGVIGQNGAGIISNNGGSVIGQNGAGIISNNGGSLGQRPVAYAALSITDAAGKPKMGKNGKPLEGVADAWGQFLIPRDEIDANSVIKVSSPHINGELKAFVAKNAETPEKELSVDMVSTISSTYILEKYVDGKQEVLEKLTPTIEAEARQDLVAALEGKADEVFNTTSTDALLSTVDRIIDGVEEVRDVFDRIEKLLILAGIVNDADGMPALQVPFSKLNGILATDEGTYTFSYLDYRLRLIDKDRIVRSVVAPGMWPYPLTPIKGSRNQHAGMAKRDGWVYLADFHNHRIVRTKGGVVETVVGTGVAGTSPDGTPASACQVSKPSGLAFGPDGHLYFTEVGSSLIRQVLADGTVKTVAGGGPNYYAPYPADPLSLLLREPKGLAFSPAGELFWIEGIGDELRKYTPQTGKAIDVDDFTNVTAMAFVGEDLILAGLGHSTLGRFSAGKVTPITVKSETGELVGDLHYESPYAISGAGGSLILQDTNLQITPLDLPSGVVQAPIAGLTKAASASALVSAERLDVNRRGDILVADKVGKRVHLQRAGGELETIAGNGELGYSPSAADALAAPLSAVEDVVWDGDDTAVFLCAGKTPCVKRVTFGGRMETIIGTGVRVTGGDKTGIATEVSLDKPQELIRLADGRIVIIEADGKAYQLTAGGRLEPFTEWVSPNWWESMRPTQAVYTRGSYLLYDADGASFVGVQNGKMTVLATRADFMPAIGTESIRAIAIDAAGRLYVATKTRVLQHDPARKATEVLAGPGGRLLNGELRDEAIVSLQDIVISAAGDLIVLEADQIKQIPQASLTAP